METKESKDFKRYHFNDTDLAQFKQYLFVCEHTGFIGINNYRKIQDAREFFYRWHLTQLIKKVHKKRKGEIWLQFTWPEIKTLHAMFQRVDCDLKMQEIQRRFHF